MPNVARMRTSWYAFLLLAFSTILPTEGFAAGQTIFFKEAFDNTNFSSRGWYDGTGGAVDSAFPAPGSAASFNCHWAVGATDCAGGTPHRHVFPASPTVYVRFWMRLGSTSVPWQGSGKPYHPHLIQLLTDADDDYVGPNSSLFSTLIETNLFRPRIAIADSMAVNVPFVGTNLFASATPHSLAGCNGNQNATTACYACPPPLPPAVGSYCNSTNWDAATPVFVNNKWHLIEFYAAMNSTSMGIAIRDGVYKYWVDGMLVINLTNVYLRSGDNPNRKFKQLLLAPFIGDGSPIAQDLWLDELIVADQPDTPLPAPTNLRVIN